MPAADRSQAGLTLVELMVTAAILSVVSALVIVTWTAMQGSYSHTMESDHARSVTREAMDRMVREIRAMQPQTEGQPAITAATANDLQFFTAFNEAAAATDPGVDALGNVRLVRYWYDYDAQQAPSEWRIYRQSDENGNGTLDSGDPVSVVARNIVNGSTLPAVGGPLPVFEYFDPYSEAPLQEPVTPGDVARVKIRLVADVDPGDAPVQFDLVSTVTPRN